MEPTLFDRKTSRMSLKMVDNAWRDSFNVRSTRVRFAQNDAPEEFTGVHHEDNSSLLELEKKANLAKPSGGDGLFAGTFFEAPTATSQSHLIGKGLSISAQQANAPAQYEHHLRDSSSGGDQPPENKGSRGKSIYNRATLVLESLTERLSSGGDSASRRRSSKEDDTDREKSTDTDRRKSAAPGPRMKSMVAKLQRATSRRRTKQEGDLAGDHHLEHVDESDVAAATVLSANNPQYSHKEAAPAPIPEGENHEDHHQHHHQDQHHPHHHHHSFGLHVSFHRHHSNEKTEKPLDKDVA